MAIEEFHTFNDKFEGCVKVENKTIYIIYIKSLNEGKGNLSKLISKAKEKFDEVKIIMPSDKMKEIVEKKGFELEEEKIKIMTWRKKWQVKGQTTQQQQ